MHWYAIVGWPVKIYIPLLCADRCRLEDLSRVMVEMDDMRIKGIYAVGMP